MTRSAAMEHSPRIHERRERRRGEILRSALRAFRERGYHATTLDHIAASLGVRKTALYHYFRDREAILYACHRESLAELDRIVKAARRLGSPSERLSHLIVHHVRVMAETLDGSPLAFEVAALSAERQHEVIEGRDRYERELRRIIEQGIRAGEFREVDAKVAAFAILGAINWVARWYRPGGTLDPNLLGEQFARHLVGGLLAVPPPRTLAPRRGARAHRAPAASTRRSLA